MATSPTQQGPDDADGAERRMNLRRARGGSSGFSSGISTSSESLRAPEDPQDDHPDLTDRVRGAVPRLAPPPAAAPDDDENRRRLAEAAMAGDAAYARDFRLNLLHRLLMRGISLDNISRELGVSISTVKADKTELYRRLRERARSLDINTLIGEQLAFYDEATAVSLRIVSQQNVPTPMRLAGIRTALAAKADQTRFLSSAGVLDVLAYRRAEDGTDLSDVQVLMQRTEEMLAQLAREEDTPPPDDPPPPRTVVRRRSRPGSFSPMTFDDRSASGSSDEIVEL